MKYYFASRVTILMEEFFEAQRLVLVFVLGHSHLELCVIHVKGRVRYTLKVRSVLSSPYNTVTLEICTGPEPISERHLLRYLFRFLLDYLD